MLDPKLNSGQVGVGACVVLSSFERPWVEPWSWLIGSRVGLSPKVKAVSLQSLQVQRFWTSRG